MPPPANERQYRTRRRAAGHAAGRADRGNPAAEKTQGARRARRSLRAARHSSRRLRSVSGGRSLRRLQHQPGQFADGEGRRALHRRARAEGAVELVAPRTQGRPARQLYRLQPRPDADAEPALFQRQGRRPRRRHARHAHRSQHPRCWYRPTIPNSPNLQAGLAKLPVFATFGGSAGIGQKLQSLRSVAQGGRRAHRLSESQLTDGTTASNEDRNYNQYGGTLRGGYELSPGVTPFVEFDADTRVHDLNTDFFGYQRNSKGLTGKAGSTFEISKLLTGEIALGYTKRVYQDPRPARHRPASSATPR